LCSRSLLDVVRQCPQLLSAVARYRAGQFGADLDLDVVLAVDPHGLHNSRVCRLMHSAGKALTVRSAADVFLGSLGNPNTARNYGIGVGKAAERLGEDRPFGYVADDEVGESLELLWGTAVKHLERPPGAGALLAGLERGARLRRVGGPGLGEADGPTGLGDLGPLEDSRRPADRPEGRCTCGRRRCGGCSTRPARGPRRFSV
jgi:hypothetical protein